MNTNFLLDLIKEVQEFEQSPSYKDDVSLDDFRTWMNEKAYQKENPTKLFQKFPHEVFDVENEICKQVILLGRFSKQMIRRGLTDFPMLANEEFTYLYRLMDYESLTKMQLIEKNAHEKQTGIEIIKRLIKSGLITEYQDEIDRRAKRLIVTNLGKEIFNQSVSNVTYIAKIVSANLSSEEKTSLLKVLKKLNEFHFTVYHEYRNVNLLELEKLM